MIELRITADSAEELTNQVRGLAALGPFMEPNTGFPVDEKLNIDSTNENAITATSPRKGRAKAKTEAPGESSPGVGETAAPSSADSLQAGSPSIVPAADPPVDKLPEEKAAESAVDYKDIQKAVVTLAAAKGREAVVEVLNTFRVDHASKVPEADRPALLADLTAAVEG